MKRKGVIKWGRGRFELTVTERRRGCGGFDGEVNLPFG